MADGARRVVVVTAAVAQIVTILVTWPLWQGRGDPPTLPVWSVLDGVPWGGALLVACVVVIVRPRIGVVGFWVVLVLAVLGDQTRIQPEVVSLGVLMTAPAFGPEGAGVARWYLASLWLWSGLHKALSLGWATGGAAVIADSLGRDGVRPVVAVVVPALEIGLGVVSLWPRSWPVVRWAGAGLHVAMVLTLSPLLGDRNSAVWAWNVALAIATFVLFSAPADDRPRTEVGRAIGVAWFVLPALFYAGWMDGYLAHNLYSSNTATAVVCAPDDGPCATAPYYDRAIDALDVPLPPEPRLYRQWFDDECAPGSELVITGIATRFTDPPTVSRHPCSTRGP